MSLFTTEQANNSNISRAESITTDGSHSYWVFGVIDEDGIYYDWKDHTLVGTASNQEQKTAIHDYLVANCEKKTPQPVIQTSTSDDIIDTLVGATAS